MSETKAPADVVLTTPKGIAIYPRLEEPDTKFDPEGRYNIKLKLEGEDAEKLAEKISELTDQMMSHKQATEKSVAKRKKLKLNDYPFVPEYDEEGEETGATLFSFSMKASGVSKKTGKQWNRRPALFDASGKPIKSKIGVGGGSIVRVNATLHPYATPKGEVGVSSRLEAVQVISLRSYMDRDASQFGFEAEDDGFQADENVAPEVDNDEAEGEDAENHGDF